MARTFNTQPFSVNTPTANQVRDYFFNHSEFKGLVNNKNFLTVDQQSFAEVNNVYITEEGLLRSRPAIKESGILVKIDNHYVALNNITDINKFGDITVYTNYESGVYYLIFVGTETAVSTTVGSKYKLIAEDNKIFIFEETKLSYYEEGAIHTADSLIYVPVTTLVTNGVQTKLDSPNKLTTSYVVRYLYDNVTALNVAALIGKDLTVNLDNIKAQIVFTSDTDLALLGQLFAIGADNKEGSNYLVSISSKGNLILSSKTTNGYIVYYSANGTTFKKLPDLYGIISKPLITEDGLHAIAITSKGPYVYSVADTQASDTFTDWTNIFSLIYHDDYPDGLSGVVNAYGHFLTYEIFSLVVAYSNKIDLFVNTIDDLTVYPLAYDDAAIVNKSATVGDITGDDIRTPDVLDSDFEFNFTSFKLSGHINCTVEALTTAAGFNRAIISSYRNSIGVLINTPCTITNVKITHANGTVISAPYASISYYDPLDAFGSYIYRSVGRSGVNNVLKSDYIVPVLLDSIIPNISDIEYFDTYMYYFNQEFKVITKLVDRDFTHKGIITVNTSENSFIVDGINDPALAPSYIDADGYLIAYNSEHYGDGIYVYNGSNYAYLGQDTGHILVKYPYIITDNKIYRSDDRFNTFITTDAIIPSAPLALNGRTLYTATDTAIYSTDASKNIYFDELINGTNKYIVPDYIAKLSEWYFTLDNELLISKYPTEGNFKWYLPEKNINTFQYAITNIHPVSDTEVAIFFKDSIYYSKQVTLSDDTAAYAYYKSKVDVGLLPGSDVITSFDGKYTIFATTRGLVAMSYQEFIASTEQAVSYVSDPIYAEFTEYAKESIKLFKTGFWIVCYKLNTNKVYLFDVRNNSWWIFNYPINPVKFIADGKEVSLLANGHLYTMYKDDNQYYDEVDSDEINIDWYLISQKLHFDAINYAKHINALTLNSVLEANDPIRLKLTVTNYRKTKYTYKTQVFEFAVDEVRTFVKKLNFFNVNEFQYKLAANTDDFIAVPLSLSNMVVKYNVARQVR